MVSRRFAPENLRGLIDSLEAGLKVPRLPSARTNKSTPTLSWVSRDAVSELSPQISRLGRKMVLPGGPPLAAALGSSIHNRCPALGTNSPTVQSFGQGPHYLPLRLY
jgi:hypothetical protein